MIRQMLAEEDADLLFADGFDDAILGVVRRAGQPSYVLYDAERCVQILQRDGGTYEEAVEHFEHNVQSAWVGPRTPGFVWIPPAEEDDDGHETFDDDADEQDDDDDDDDTDGESGAAGH